MERLWAGLAAPFDISPRARRIVVIEDALWGSHPALSFLVSTASSPDGPIIVADPQQPPPIQPLDPSQAEIKLFLASGAETILHNYLTSGVMLNATEGIYNSTPDQPATYTPYHAYTVSQPKDIQ